MSTEYMAGTHVLYEVQTGDLLSLLTRCTIVGFFRIFSIEKKNVFLLRLINNKDYQEYTSHIHSLFYSRTQSQDPQK